MDIFFSIIGVVLFVFVILFQMIYIYTTIAKTKNSRFRSTNRFLDEIRMSILIPSYNEESVVKGCLRGLNSLNYSNYEVVFINDGSTDDTLEVLKDELGLRVEYMVPNGLLEYSHVKEIYRSEKYPNIIVIDKVNGGKADALNAGSDFATGEVVITLDADSMLESNSLIYINEKFHDEKVIAAGGMVHVGQSFNAQGTPSFKGNFLIKYQLSEYLMSFYVRKFTQAKLNMLSIVSGAFGAFRRGIIYQINGYKKTLGEDMEITLNIQKFISSSNQGYKMIFIPKAECYTEIPENLRDVFKQKTRWQKGFIDCIVKYRSDFFRSLNTWFTLFLFWDSMGMAILGITAIVMLPIMLIFGEVTVYYMYILTTSMFVQITTKVLGYWSAHKHGHVFSNLDYMKIMLFFILEMFIRPLFDSSMFLYGTISYFAPKNRHDWNKVKRLGNVNVSSKKAG